MFQKLIFAGNLGGDPTMRILENGTEFCNFSVADTRKYKTQTGEDKSETTWFKVVVYGKQAAACNEYLKKGSSVIVEGRLIPDENGGPKVWKDKQEQSRASFDVRADSVRFLGGKPKEEQSAEETF